MKSNKKAYVKNPQERVRTEDCEELTAFPVTFLISLAFPSKKGNQGMSSPPCGKV